MFNNYSTSRIRRKVKTKLSNIRDKVQEEILMTKQEFSATEGENFHQKFKRYINKRLEDTSSSSNTESSSEDADSSDEGGRTKKSLKQRFVHIFKRA